MNSLQNLQLARMAYKEIREVVDKWERGGIPESDLIIHAHWHGCITVNGYYFQEGDLIEIYKG